METDHLSLPEIASLIKYQAVLKLGPWPRDLQLFIFATKATWSCGLSPALQIGDMIYRDGVLAIARELRSSIKARSGE